jgi:hypothetical protein
LLIRISCRFCKTLFFLCRFCYRGHAYCCDLCRELGKLKNQREAQHRYRQTEKGKKAHRENENRRRQRLKFSTVKNMDDTGSSLYWMWCMVLQLIIEVVFLQTPNRFGAPQCRFCGSRGRVVDKFPRRGYGKAPTNA